MKIFVSACLLGIPCRYDGNEKRNESVCALAKTHTLIPFCPEIYGGLPIPRTPAEIANGRVMTRDGRDVTRNYQAGAREALRVYQMLSCDMAILQDKSPSCGVGVIHDGTFAGGLTAGNGVCAQLFIDENIPVVPASKSDRIKGAIPK